MVLTSWRPWGLLPWLAVGPAIAEDWPGWRGAHRDGLSQEVGLHFEWAAEPPPLRWQSAGCGRGYSSLAVADGRIFTLGRREEGECLVAFSEKDGSFLWAAPFAASKHSNGTPVVDGDRVYAIGRDGVLACLSAGDGGTVWMRDFREDFGGRMMSGWGYSESPLIDGERLVCTPGGKDAFLVALDKRSGREIWRSPAPADPGPRGKDGAGYASMVVSHAAGVKQYVQLTGRGLIGVRAVDGRVLWTYNRVANGTANIATPLVQGNHVFASTGYGTGSALLHLQRGSDGVEAHEDYFLEAGTLQNHHGGMLLVGEHVYCGHAHNNGFPICVHLASGEVAWGGDIRGPGRGSASIAYADGHLIFRYQNGPVAAIAADPTGYRLRGSFQPVVQEGNSWAQPVVANGRLYLREQDALMCYDLRPDPAGAAARNP